MSTKIIKLTGIGRWVKPYPGQEDTKYGKKAVMDLYLDEPSLITFKSSGSRTTLRKDENGEFVKLSRDIDQLYRDEPLGYPLVVKKNENGVYEKFDKIIGNGSRVTAKVSVYDSKYGPGTRWEELEIIEHVPYESYSSPKVSESALADGKYKF